MYFFKVFGGFVRAWVDPIFTSVGLVFSGVAVNHRQTRTVQSV